MNIVIPAPTRALPKIKKLARLLIAQGPLDSRHQITVLMVPTALEEVQKYFDGIANVKFAPVLSSVYREPPASANEPFMAAAKLMTERHWFYLTPETVPLAPDWADCLDREYRQSGKKYLGFQANIPRRFRDSAGIDRVDLGDPYILEAAIYPANLLRQTKITPRQQGAHHEVQRRQEMVKQTCLSEVIASAEWGKGWQPPLGIKVATRLLDDAVVDNLLRAAPAPLAANHAPVLEIASLEEVEWADPPPAKLPFDPSQVERNVAGKRPRGRPARVHS